MMHWCRVSCAACVSIYSAVVFTYQTQAAMMVCPCRIWGRFVDFWRLERYSIDIVRPPFPIMSLDSVWCEPHVYSVHLCRLPFPKPIAIRITSNNLLWLQVAGYNPKRSPPGRVRRNVLIIITSTKHVEGVLVRSGWLCMRTESYMCDGAVRFHHACKGSGR